MLVNELGKLNINNIVIIQNRVDVLLNRHIVEELFAIYTDKDIELDYRESPENILNRVTSESGNPITFLLAHYSPQTSEIPLSSEVEGGCIVEFYTDSKVLLLTYLFVKSSKRKKGVAKNLIDCGVSKVIDSLNAKGQKVEFVLLEAKNPFLIPDFKLKSDAAERLSIFKSLNAKWIDLKYLHPPILIGNQVMDGISDLLLLVLPFLTSKNFFLSTETLNIFLLEYYHSLGAIDGDIMQVFLNMKQNPIAYDDPAMKLELKLMFDEIKTNQYYLSKYIYLKEIPRFEKPRVNFFRASLCFEFLVDEALSNYNLDFGGNIEEKHKHNPENDYNYCNFFHSYETDLFSFHFQENPPYYTKSWESIAATKISIFIPNVSEFISEGRKEMLFSFDASTDTPGFKILSARAFVNYTYFKDSKIRIWHLIITTDGKEPFTELDTIKLLKIFNGAQERASEEKGEQNKYLKGIKFKIEDRPEFYSISDLIYGLTGVSYADENGEFIRINSPSTGIIEIDTEYSSFLDYTNEPKSKENSFNDLYALIADAKKLDDRIDYYNLLTDTESDFFEYLCGTLCGISLGILDFKRMGYEEVMDTLIPRSETKFSFISLNRGLLCLVGASDNVLSSSWNTLGISPYLIIPSAVLAHNQYLVEKAEKQIDNINKKVRNVAESNSELIIQIKDSNQSYSDVNELINIFLLKNIFQYPTEKDLFDYGSEHRKIFEKVKIVSEKMNQLKNHISNLERKSSAISERKNKEVLINQYIGTAFSGFLSAASLHSIISDSLSVDGKKWLPVLDSITFLIAALIWYFIFKKSKPDLN